MENQNKTYTTIRAKMKKMRQKIALMKIAITTLVIVVVSLMVAIGFLVKENQNLNLTVTQNNEVLTEKNRQIVELTVENHELHNIIDEIDDQIEYVESVNQSYVDELNELRKRSELYDKYEYAINYGGERTELTYEEIQYGEELMIAKGLNPHLMFGTIMVESSGNPGAVNSSSGATGYGQFLDSTAKWVWTKLLGNKSYSSNIRKDGMKNIQMMAEYYDFLYAETGSTFKVVKQYSGNSTDEGAARYLARVNNFTKKVGEVIN